MISIGFESLGMNSINQVPSQIKIAILNISSSHEFTIRVKSKRVGSDGGSLFFSSRQRCFTVYIIELHMPALTTKLKANTERHVTKRGWI